LRSRRQSDSPSADKRRWVIVIVPQKFAMSQQNSVEIGSMVLAKPKHFDFCEASARIFLISTSPFNYGSQHTQVSGIGRHLVVVLTTPDDDDKVLVASMAHKHPGNPPQKPTSYFNLPTDPVKGEGTINVGIPHRISRLHLKTIDPPFIMDPQDLAALKEEIRKPLDVYYLEF